MAPKADTLLKDYRAKRDFKKTAEPSGAASRPVKAKALSFVVQKHDATRLHYDFRLELDGVLKSWAVTKGPSPDPAQKRLAVRVEDHPLDYGTFEGTIPEGEYGGGTVMLWDRGTWEPIGDPHEGLETGDLKFRLDGERMKGEWVLVHMKGRDQPKRGGGTRENWLLIKHDDEHVDRQHPEALTETFTTSVETGRDLDGIAKGLKSKRRGAKPAEGGAKVWTSSGAMALPEFRTPQLATLVDEVPAGNAWLFEMKYDGYRALAAIAGDQVRLYTRNGNDWTTQFGTLVGPLSKLTRGSALIDGEICAVTDAGKTDFSTLKLSLSSGAPLIYFAFDLLEQDGEDLSGLPLSERKARLEALLRALPKSSPIRFSDHVRGHGEKVFKAMCAAGEEGVIAKLADAPYRGERTRQWLKIKCIQRQEFVIGGWRPSEKKKGFASLLLGTFENGKLIYRGRVGTGFNAENSAALQQALDKRARKTPAFEAVPRAIARQAHWVDPELVGEIAFTEFTPDGVLRHPSFLGLREDKTGREVKLELPADTDKVAETAEAEVKAKVPRKAKAASKASAKSGAVAITIEAGIAAAKTAGVKITSPDRIAYPGQGVTKGELLAYYATVAPAMLKHLSDHPLSLVRCPQGRAKYCFFQKHDSGGFPEAVKKVPITEKDGSVEDYLYVDGPAGILASVQMNALEFHIWGSRRQDIEKPDRIIFDIDPDEGLGFDAVRRAAVDMRDLLDAVGLKAYPMVTGGKGVHVIAPIKAGPEWPEVKAFCKGFADKLADAEPERFIATMSKAKRKGKMFIDYLRNERGSTAIAPYSTRSREGAPVAVPVTWDELATLDRANGFGLAEAAARALGDDPWPDYFKLRQTITRPMLKAVGAEPG